MDSASSPAHSLRSTAWLIVALLFPVALLNYLDRQMIASMKASVMHDIPSIGSEANWGYMLGQFKWVYAILSPIGGYIADRFSRRFTICASLFCWSAITYATGQVETYEGLLWTRTLMGISEAFYIPAALALIADYHPSSTRSRAVGVHQIGIYAGVITGSFAGYAADAPELGWRWMFDITGVVGLLYALPLLWFLRDARREIAGALPVRQKISPARSARELLTNGAFILLVLYFTLPAMAAWIVRDWMPAILQKELNLKQGLAGVSAVVYWQGAAIVSAILGGWLADRWMRRTARARIYVSALGVGCIIPAMLGVGVVLSQGSLPLAIMFLILFGLGWGLFDGNNMPILSQIVRPELRATGYGVMNLVSISCGGFADWGFGALRDAKVPLNLIFGAFAGLALVSIVLVLLIRPRDMEKAPSAESSR
jgi:MFS transporter, Spinster family, sphingosine-1-phosphate transporter